MTNEVAKNTPGQDLCDLLYGLQMSTKILENIHEEFNEGTRSQQDFQSRFHSQATLLNGNLKKIKPLVEKMFEIAYSKFVIPEFPEPYMPLGNKCYTDPPTQTKDLPETSPDVPEKV
jgi:hypothetical protein